MKRIGIALFLAVLLACASAAQILIGVSSYAPASNGPVVKGTAAHSTDGTAASTSVTTGSWTAAANALLVCHTITDENGSGTTVSGIVVSGSPSYSTAWVQLPTNGYVIDSGQLTGSLWYAVTSSGFTAQTATATISSSERANLSCQSYTGITPSNPIPASNNAKAQTVNVTSSGNTGSLYAGFFGCGTNQGTVITTSEEGSGFTLDAAVNGGGTATQWVHEGLETKDTAVTPAATTTVNFAVGGICGSGAGFFQIIAIEIH